jgi:hypothetical protein
MLKYMRERSEARIATPGRRNYNYASAAIMMAVGIWVFSTGAPGWMFLAAVAAVAAFDVFLTSKWVREDALRDSQAAGRSV